MLHTDWCFLRTWAATADWGNVPGWLGALASVGTLCVAMAAALIARGQLEHARILREEQARPFVIVDFEPTRAGDMRYMDLVIRNTGGTLARDVNVVFDPPIVSTLDPKGEESDHLATALARTSLLQGGIPTLPPGREYRMLFDDMADRFERKDLPRRYEVTVSMRSERKIEPTLTQILDLDVYYGYMNVHEYGLHHIAKSLRALAKKLGATNF